MIHLVPDVSVGVGILRGSTEFSLGVNMKKHLAILLLVSPSLVLAAGSTINFRGQVNSQTCQVMVDGAANPVVLLPTVATGDLAAAGTSAGETPFVVSVSGCTASAVDKPKDKLKIKTQFLASAATSGNNIPNLGTAKNVALQLRKSVGGDPISLVGGSAVSVEGLEVAAGSTSASHTFAVRYVAEGGAAEAGSVIGSVQYALDYF
jgi:major type 1 subunit fimbrin (pilin)